MKEDRRAASGQALKIVLTADRLPSPPQLPGSRKTRERKKRKSAVKRKLQQLGALINNTAHTHPSLWQQPRWHQLRPCPIRLPPVSAVKPDSCLEVVLVERLWFNCGSVHVTFASGNGRDSTTSYFVSEQKRTRAVVLSWR